VHLKFHPRSDMKRYESILNSFDYTHLPLGTSINESIAIVDPDFVIVYNSTVYYEYYIKGIITFRYSVGANDIPFGLNDEFANFEELMIRFNEFKNKSEEELSEEVNSVINRFCALGVNNYRKILN
jgi:hypothetical protein